MTQPATVQPEPAPAVATVPELADRPFKRALDLGLTSLGLVLSLPIWLVAALAIKLEDGGPIFYAQRRWGRGGRTFVVRKFRTMRRESQGGATPRQARVGDARVTRVGRVLRAMGADELPQLLNILRGEMSLVGPRALAVDEVVHDERGRPIRYEDVAGFASRLQVRPGLTSLATVYIAKDAAPSRKFRYDLLYVRRRGLWLDIRLIVLSLWVSFRGKWESRGHKV